jgi:SpoIID/LytB domain protein
MDRRNEVAGRLDGTFTGNVFGPVSGSFRAKAAQGSIIFTGENGEKIAASSSIILTAGPAARFQLFDVTIGNRFHWERNEDQTFRGDLLFIARPEGTMAVINRLPLEHYLQSVISSEMSAGGPTEFLKTHAVLSRSWLLAALQRAGDKQRAAPALPDARGEEVIRWYEREEHDLFDVCADDHCQRYQGVTRITSVRAEEAVNATRGFVLMSADQICDARYSKACGGVTEVFGTAWEDRQIGYLKSVSDSPHPFDPIETEESAETWILSSPDAYCSTADKELLATLLPDFDRETTQFFRWTVDYQRRELEEIIREKSGFDFGVLREIVPLRRGPSGRIMRLRITGSRRSMVVGKELEIRRWLSRSHLYSSAFVVKVQRGTDGEAERFIFHGAGWGHGVGLCQIGAAVMASRGFSSTEILKHYFTGVEIVKVY